MKINIKNCAEGSYIAPSCETIVLSSEQLICSSDKVESLTDNGDEFTW